MKKLLFLLPFFLLSCVDENVFRDTSTYDSAFINIWNDYSKNHDLTSEKLRDKMKSLKNVNGELQFFYIIKTDSGFLKNDTLYKNPELKLSEYYYVKNYISNSEKLDSIYSIHRTVDLFKSRISKSKIKVVDYNIEFNGGEKMRSVWVVKSPVLGN